MPGLDADQAHRLKNVRGLGINGQYAFMLLGARAAREEFKRAFSKNDFRADFDLPRAEIDSDPRCECHDFRML
jgi:hypothetical protein